MNSRNVNYKLLNFGILIGVIYLLYAIKGLWLGIFGQIMAIIFPFLIAFAGAYAVYPIVKKLQEKGFPKWLAVSLIAILIIGMFALIIIIMLPLLYDQTLLFITNIMDFVQEISTKYELNLGIVQTTLADTIANLTKTVGTYISDGAISFLNASIGIVTNLIIIIFVAVYFLMDMDKIRTYIKKRSRGKYRMFHYLKNLDREISNYFNGFGKIIFIQLIEYTAVFFLIGHPNYLLLGILASVTTIIPYFGGVIVNILAVVIASVISTKLLILTLIACLVLPLIDGYIISPKVYGKTNRIHPLIIIFAVFAGGILGGVIGIAVSLPVVIIIITTYQFFEKDINNTIDNIKEKI